MRINFTMEQYCWLCRQRIYLSLTIIQLTFAQIVNFIRWVNSYSKTPTTKELIMESESASNQLGQNDDKDRRRDERLLISTKMYTIY